MLKINVRPLDVAHFVVVSSARCCRLRWQNRAMGDDGGLSWTWLGLWPLLMNHTLKDQKQPLEDEAASFPFSFPTCPFWGQYTIFGLFLWALCQAL